MQELIIYFTLGGHKASIELEAQTPEEALQTAEDLLKEVSEKVANIKIADRRSGYFLRGFS